jgi:hypothetical protein
MEQLMHKMKYKVHKLDIKPNEDQDKLERFLNKLKGEVISVIPNTETVFLCYGAKVKSVLIIEKIRK